MLAAVAISLILVALFFMYRRLREVIRSRTQELVKATERMETEAAERRRMDRELHESEERKLQIVSDLRDARAALRVQASFFEQLFVQSPVAAEIVDSCGNRKRVNNRWSDLFGCDLREAGRYYENILRDPAIVRSGIVPSLTKALAVGANAEWELNIELPGARPRLIESRRRWLTMRTFPTVDPGGGLADVIVHYEDVTAQREEVARTKRLLKEKELLLKEIHHRVKNNMQLMKSLLNLQAEFVTDAKSLSMFRESADRINTMAQIHDKLYQSEEFGSIHIREYLQFIADSLAKSYVQPGKEIRVDTALDAAVLDIDTAIPCGLIANELVSNCLKHAFSGRPVGRIFVRFSVRSAACGPHYELVVEDDGAGLPGSFDWERTESLGMKLVQALAQQLDGKVELISTPAHGTRIAVSFRQVRWEELRATM